MPGTRSGYRQGNADTNRTLTYQNACAREHWLSVCPELAISDGCEEARLAEDVGEPEMDIHNMINRVKEDGYTVLTDSGVSPVDLRKLESSIDRLQESGLPATFVMMYDEPWLLMHAVSQLMMKVTGNKPNMDMLAWRVDARKGEAGFAPHRDRQPDDAQASFREDGSAMYTSCWLAVSDATPDTGCLYVIPREQDPGYLRGDPEDAAAPDPLKAALPCKEAFQHVRALPCLRGGAVVFTHRILHWGSAGTPHAPHPRVSVSFGFSDDAFEAPYIDRKHLPLPPLRIRLALVSAQMLTYYQRFPPSTSLLSLYKAAIDAAAGELEDGYRRKVLAEFVRAARENHEGAAADGAAARNSAQRGAGAEEGEFDADEEDVVDAAMEAMLDAELEGQHDFEDDFDELAEHDPDAPAPPDGEDAEAEDEHDGRRPTAAAAGGALDAEDANRRVQGDNTPRGSENNEARAPPAHRARHMAAHPAALVPAAMAAGGAARVVRADSHSVGGMRSGPGESSTVLCTPEVFDAGSDACTSAAAGWEFGPLVWGKKRKR